MYCFAYGSFAKTRSLNVSMALTLLMASYACKRSAVVVAEPAEIAAEVLEAEAVEVEEVLLKIHHHLLVHIRLQ